MKLKAVTVVKGIWISE